MIDMDRDVALRSLLKIAPRLARILVWTVFTVVHLMLGFLILGALWWWQIKPEELQSAFSVFFRSPLGSKSLGLLAFLGMSGAAMIWAYARAWRYALHKLLETFLFG